MERAGFTSAAAEVFSPEKNKKTRAAWRRSRHIPLISTNKRTGICLSSFLSEASLDAERKNGTKTEKTYCAAAAPCDIIKRD